MTRTQLRQQLRLARRQLSAIEQAMAAKALLQRFLTCPLATYLLTPHKVGLYLSHDGEISADAIIEQAWQYNIELYLPVLNGETLRFGRYQRDSQWQTNRFGILEPCDPEPIVGTELNLVLLPLVGFDANGGRLGMGGGFYDKTFAQRPSSTKLVGLAHDRQQVESLPIETWDVPLDAILTPTQYIDISDPSR